MPILRMLRRRELRNPNVERPDVFPLRVLYWSTPDIVEILGRAAEGRRYRKAAFYRGRAGRYIGFHWRFLGAVQGWGVVVRRARGRVVGGF